ncbi:MAG: ATP-binding protein [Prevotella buccae]|nr:hypothetical protein HMPREF0649_01880 [Segatella buccae D17]MBS5896320.1 ATP-binding protein [Segatella buccae]
MLYANTARLMAQLRMAKMKGIILQELKKIERVDLLILNDFALQLLTRRQGTISWTSLKTDMRENLHLLLHRYLPRDCMMP